MVGRGVHFQSGGLGTYMRGEYGISGFKMEAGGFQSIADTTDNTEERETRWVPERSRRHHLPHPQNVFRDVRLCQAWRVTCVSTWAVGSDRPTCESCGRPWLRVPLKVTFPHWVCRWLLHPKLGQQPGLFRGAQSNQVGRLTQRAFFDWRERRWSRSSWEIHSLGRIVQVWWGRDRAKGRRGLLTYSQRGREDLSPLTVSSWVLQTRWVNWKASEPPDRSPILLMWDLGDPRQRARPTPAPPGWCGNLLGQQWKPLSTQGRLPPLLTAWAGLSEECPVRPAATADPSRFRFGLTLSRFRGSREEKWPHLRRASRSDEKSSSPPGGAAC